MGIFFKPHSQLISDKKKHTHKHPLQNHRKEREFYLCGLNFCFEKSMETPPPPQLIINFVVRLIIDLVVSIHKYIFCYCTFATITNFLLKGPPSFYPQCQ